MLIQFTLSMPSNNAWNHRWSGQGNLYAVVKNITSKKTHQRILAEKDHYYNFGDGWVACVSVKEIDTIEARKVRKESKGFCGYDWMVDSIRYCGKIQKDKWAY